MQDTTKQFSLFQNFTLYWKLTNKNDKYLLYANHNLKCILHLHLLYNGKKLTNTELSRCVVSPLDDVSIPRWYKKLSLLKIRDLKHKSSATYSSM